MNVDFNNLRKKIIKDYNALVDGLTIAGDIKTHLDDLRTDIITLGCLYEEGNNECKCILDGSIDVKTYVPKEGE
jgi:hypothetical protein